MVIDYKRKVSSVLWDDVYWVNKFFDLTPPKQIRRKQVNALFLLLRAASILVIDRKGTEVRWNIGRRDLPSRANAGTPLFRDDCRWIGIPTHDEDRQRKNETNNSTT